MIYGIGTDIIEVERIKRSLEKDNVFRDKIFTQSEINYCEAKTNKAEHYSVRFAAKEAFFKALGTGWRGGMAFCEIEVGKDELGKPEIYVHGEVEKYLEKFGPVNIYLTLSHVKLMAVAFVVIQEKFERKTPLQ